MNTASGITPAPHDAGRAVLKVVGLVALLIDRIFRAIEARVIRWKD